MHNSDARGASDGISVLSFLDTILEVSPGEFIVARDKYRVISAYAVFCILDCMRRHCHDCLLLLAAGGAAGLEDFLAHSQIIRRVVCYLLPVTANESNPNIYQECLKILQCGTQHFRSLIEFVAERDCEWGETTRLESAAARCAALEAACFKLVLHRSAELHPQQPQQAGDRADRASAAVLRDRWALHAVLPAFCPPALCAPSPQTASEGGGVMRGGGSVRTRRTTNSMLCATESFLYIVSALDGSSGGSSGALSASSCLLTFIRQPLHIYGITALAEYFTYVNSEPVVSINNRYMNNKSLGTRSPSAPPSGSTSWRTQADSGERQELGTAPPRASSSDYDSEVAASSYLGLLLDKCSLGLGSPPRRPCQRQQRCQGHAGEAERGPASHHPRDLQGKEGRGGHELISLFDS